MSVRLWDRGLGGLMPKDNAAWLGYCGFAATWAFFVPLNAWAKLTHQDEFWILGSEAVDGGFVETATVAFYGCAIACAVILFRRASTIYGHQSAPAWRVLLMLGILGFIGMIGEEISWGQHWLGFATPEGLAEINLQHESNVHNLVSPRLYDTVYQVMGFTLILSPPAPTYLAKPWGHLTIVRFLRDCFSWPATYAMLISAGILLQHEAFEELSEMVLALAVFQALWSLSLQINKPQSPTPL
ncbi:MAG: hypothetical protein RL230_1454 [Pseudomonadota bacterium]|jgi:hypothetical protein